jgi:hypothetical protein
MLETISNVIKFVTSMQISDGRNLALEDYRWPSVLATHGNGWGVTLLLSGAPAAPAPAQQVATPPAPESAV